MRSHSLFYCRFRSFVRVYSLTFIFYEHCVCQPYSLLGVFAVMLWQRVRLLEGSFLQVLLGIKMVIYHYRYRDKL